MQCPNHKHGNHAACNTCLPARSCTSIEANFIESVVCDGIHDAIITGLMTELLMSTIMKELVVRSIVDTPPLE
jgi:hypothetical protein